MYLIQPGLFDLQFFDHRVSACASLTTNAGFADIIVVVPEKFTEYQVAFIIQ